MSPRVLLVCGTIHQTEMLYQIGKALNGADCFYTPFYLEGLLQLAGQMGLLDFTAAAGSLRKRTETYLRNQGLQVDDRGIAGDYDLVITCTDITIQRNLKHTPIVLIQEGITEPQGFRSRLVRTLGLPRYLANTANFGLSSEYELFCVASDGYKAHFARLGAPVAKIAVTGLPGFDNLASFHHNEFAHHDYVLVATSNGRETFKFENRRAFLEQARHIAAGRKMIFKLHPAEDHARAIREIRAISNESQILTEGDIRPMIANCSVLICKHSTVALFGIAMEKEVHSDVDLELLRSLKPLQNGGASARRIASSCERFIFQRQPRKASRGLVRSPGNLDAARGI